MRNQENGGKWGGMGEDGGNRGKMGEKITLLCLCLVPCDWVWLRGVVTETFSRLPTRIFWTPYRAHELAAEGLWFLSLFRAPVAILPAVPDTLCHLITFGGGDGGTVRDPTSHTFYTLWDCCSFFRQLSNTTTP